MRYSARALRLVDILALVLAGTGVLCLLLAGWTAILLGDAGPSRYGQDPRLWIIGYATLGIAFTCLGVALNLRLIRVRANGGREPDGARQPRPGWAEAARDLRARGDDRLIDKPDPTRFDLEDWEW